MRHVVFIVWRVWCGEPRPSWSVAQCSIILSESRQACSILCFKTREPDGDGPRYSSTGPAMIRLCCHDTPVVGQFNPAFFLKAKLQGQHTETDENGGVELEKDALFHLNKFVKSPRARDQYPNVEFNYAGHFQLPPLKPHVQQMQLNDAEIDESFGEPPIMRCACFHRLYLVRARRSSARRH